MKGHTVEEQAPNKPCRPTLSHTLAHGLDPVHTWIHPFPILSRSLKWCSSQLLPDSIAPAGFELRPPDRCGWLKCSLGEFSVKAAPGWNTKLHSRWGSHSHCAALSGLETAVLTSFHMPAAPFFIQDARFQVRWDSQVGSLRGKKGGTKTKEVSITDIKHQFPLFILYPKDACSCGISQT